jgi:hypothetical protein
MQPFDNVVARQAELMLEECFANFGLDQGRIPVIICSALTNRRGTLAYARNYNVSGWIPEQEVLDDILEIASTGKFHANMTDLEAQRLAEFYIMKNVMIVVEHVGRRTSDCDSEIAMSEQDESEQE